MGEFVTLDQGPGAVPQGVRASSGTGNVDTGTQRVTLASNGFFAGLFSSIVTVLTNSLRTEEINPLSTQHTPGVVDVTDQADATYDYYYDMENYAKTGFQLALNCGLGTVTATCWVTLQNDGTAPAACAYQDATNDAFGVAQLQAAAGAAADLWVDNAGMLGLAKYVRIRIVAATGGAGAQLGDWSIYHKRMAL